MYKNTILYNIYSRGSLLHLSISLWVLGRKNIEDPWSRHFLASAYIAKSSQISLSFWVDVFVNVFYIRCSFISSRDIFILSVSCPSHVKINTSTSGHCPSATDSDICNKFHVNVRTSMPVWSLPYRTTDTPWRTMSIVHIAVWVIIFLGKILLTVKVSKARPCSDGHSGLCIVVMQM